MTQITDWIRAHEALLWWLGAGSVLMFIGSLVLIPFVLAMLPADYFSHQARPRHRWAAKHPLAWIVYLVIKNVFGVLLVALGLLLLLLPGQGLLSILAGIILMNIPGKFRLVRWIVRRPTVQSSINWLRRIANRPPLVMDE